MQAGIQYEMPMHGVVPAMGDAPAELVAMCNTAVDAVNLCMRLARIPMPLEDWANKLDMKKGTLSILLNGGTRKRRRYFNPDDFIFIQQIAGNRAIAQYFEMESKGMLNRQ